MAAEWDRIAALLIQKYNNTLDTAGETELKDWMALSRNNELLYNELEDKEYIIEELKKLDPADKAIAWKLISEKAFPSQRAEVPIKKMTWRRYAAAAALAGVVAGAYLLYPHKPESHSPSISPAATVAAEIGPGRSRATLTLSNGKTIVLDSATNDPIQEQGGVRIQKLGNGQLAYQAAKERTSGIVYNVLTTPKAGQFEIVLPDGSKVWLNNASSLRYSTTMGRTERTLELHGEAYFEVAKNKSMPFVVRSGNLQVEVLGTNFNLMAYEDEDAQKTTLLTGTVRVLKGADQVVLKPGQQSSIDRAGYQRVISGVDLDEVVAWKNGYFHFAGTDWQGIMRQLARWYDVDVQYTGKLPAQVFSGEIQRSLPLSLVLKGLEGRDIHFTIENRKIIVRP